MMLPGTAMRDIMVHNVMTPFANLFRTRGNANVHSNRVRREAGRPWSREQRRRWWRALGELSRSTSESSWEKVGDHPKTFTIPVDESNIPKSRRKRTVVGLYSYAPWLTNNVSLRFLTFIPMQRKVDCLCSHLRSTIQQSTLKTALTNISCCV